MNSDNGLWALLEELKRKKGITEIVVNDSNSIFVEKDGSFIQLNISILEEDIKAFVSDVVKFNGSHHMIDDNVIDGILPDGSRVNIIRGKYVQNKNVITIRKYAQKHLTLKEADGAFGINEHWQMFFKALIGAKKNIVISGGTGAGKTTLLNLLLNEIDQQERIITIEDTRELIIKLPNCVRLEGLSSRGNNSKELSFSDLVKNTLRMRPDRIIVGELRGAEVFDFLQAINTGHDGSLSTVHSNGASDCINRLENLFLMSGHELPNKVVRKQLADGVDFIIQVNKTANNERVISEIVEVTGMESGVVTMHQIATHENGALKSTGISPKSLNELNKNGGLPTNFFSL